MKKWKGFVAVILILACLGGLGYYAAVVLGNTQSSQANAGQATDLETIKLGLDLSGGVSVTYRIKDENPSQTDIDDTIAKLEQRIESDQSISTTEYSVYQIGDDRIAVEIPGVYDAAAVLENLGSPGSLYFITHYDSEGNENYSYDSTVDAAYSPYSLNYDLDTLIENGSVILTGEDVKSATAAYQTDQLNNTEPVVQLEFTSEAAAIFGEASTEAYNNNKDSIGIYYDDHFISVPSVKNPITDGHCVISEMGSFEEAQSLATFIRVGAMKLELEVLESNVVGAQLGGQALTNSVKAAAIGIAIVMVFMIVMYGISGVSASVALGLYTVLVVLFLDWFQITLTLPGIAGIILGIGMAVDANVIIFARIREEIGRGMSVSSAIKEGYKKALSAILDGQVTTFIAALVLMVLGSGTVKGFAYTLMISIVLSLFTSLVVAKLFMQGLYAIGFKSEKLYGRVKERKPFDFMKHRVVYFVISIVIIIAGIGGMVGYSVTGSKALNYSLEFVGGTSTTIDNGQEYSISEIEETIVPLVQQVIGNETVQANTVDNSTQIVLKTRTLTPEESADLQALVESELDGTVVEAQSISSTVSDEMRRDAVLAVIVACICMLLYIWFRFKDIRFATSAITALVHDVLVVLTAYALIRISVGNTFIACMLTIVGYSVNDTIVIFDRIRENLKSVKVQTRESLAEVANKSLTQTLSRSINTSITTFIMVLLLYIFGVASIREFALPLMVGLICGSYSSIFIATELWYVMKLHVGKNRVRK